MPEPTKTSHPTALATPSGGKLPLKSARDDRGQHPSYYDVPMLKESVWEWQVATYFFFGGIAAGSFVLARVARRFGHGRYAEVARSGTLLAAACVVPCAPLLIWDLGDPTRFHHMLRVFKPTSPMNLGSWALTGFSGIAMITSIDELVRPHRWSMAKPSRRSSLLALAADIVGIPLALVMAGYTGVLLSCTATPVWSQNIWLGPLFSASSMSTGASAVSMVLETRKMLKGRHRETAAGHAMQIIHTAGHISETAAYIGYRKVAGPLAEPLTKGSQSKVMAVAAVAMVAAEALNWLPARGRKRTLCRLASAACGITGGYALRWAMVHAGHESGCDPHAARLSTKPKTPGIAGGGASGRAH